MYKTTRITCLFENIHQIGENEGEIKQINYRRKKKGKVNKQEKKHRITERMFYLEETHKDR